MGVVVMVVEILSELPAVCLVTGMGLFFFFRAAEVGGARPCTSSRAALLK